MSEAAAARADAKREAKHADMLWMLERTLEEVNEAGIDGGEDEASAKFQSVSDDVKEMICRYLVSPDDAAAIADRLLRADDELAERVQELNILRKRAKAKHARIRWLLWSSLKAWGESQPRAEGTKTVRLGEYSTRRLTWRKGTDKVEVADDEAFDKWWKETIGREVALGLGVIKETVYASDTGIRAYIQETGEIPPGVEVTPAEDVCTLYRR